MSEWAMTLRPAHRGMSCRSWRGSLVRLLRLRLPPGVEEVRRRQALVREGAPGDALLLQERAAGDAAKLELQGRQRLDLQERGVSDWRPEVGMEAAGQCARSSQPGHTW